MQTYGRYCSRGLSSLRLRSSRRLLTLLVVLTAATTLSHGEEQTAGRGKQLTPTLTATPPMGWNPWNAFRTEVTEAKILSVADALLRNGLKESGYRFIDVDDGWWLKRDASGRIVVRTTMFPSAALPNGQTSLRPFVDHLHALGFRAGLYTDIGRNACSQAWDRSSPNLPVGTVAEREIGSLDHQSEDMRLIFGEWAFDSLKVDACGLADFGPDRPYVKDATFRSLGPYIVRSHPTEADSKRVEQLYAGLKKQIDVVRPDGNYVFSVCTWGEANAQAWARKYGNTWRTSADIEPTWDSMLKNFDSAALHPELSVRGHASDPDMLEIGNGAFDANHLVEARAHFSLWAMLSAPLILGSDVTKWSPSLVEIAGNRDVIAVDQDSGGHQGIVLTKTDRGQVMVKTLSDGSTVVAFVNRKKQPLTLSLQTAMLHLDGPLASRDLWTQEERALGRVLTANLTGHETRLLRIRRTTGDMAAIVNGSEQRRRRSIAP